MRGKCTQHETSILVTNVLTFLYSDNNYASGNTVQIYMVMRNMREILDSKSRDRRPFERTRLRYRNDRAVDVNEDHI